MNKHQTLSYFTSEIILIQQKNLSSLGVSILLLFQEPLPIKYGQHGVIRAWQKFQDIIRWRNNIKGRLLLSAFYHQILCSRGPWSERGSLQRNLKSSVLQIGLPNDIRLLAEILWF